MSFDVFFALSDMLSHFSRVFGTFCDRERTKQPGHKMRKIGQNDIYTLLTVSHILQMMPWFLILLQKLQISGIHNQACILARV